MTQVMSQRPRGPGCSACAWVRRAEARAARAGGGRPARAVHARCCSRARPAQGRKRKTGLGKRAAYVFFGVSIQNICQGPRNLARSLRGRRGLFGGGGGCSARTPRPQDGLDEGEMRLRTVLLRVRLPRAPRAREPGFSDSESQT